MYNNGQHFVQSTRVIAISVQNTEIQADDFPDRPTSRPPQRPAFLIRPGS